MATQRTTQSPNLTRATLSKIEARLRRVNDAELWLLAAALGAEMADLFPAGARRKPPGVVVRVPEPKGRV